MADYSNAQGHTDLDHGALTPDNHRFIIETLGSSSIGFQWQQFEAGGGVTAINFYVTCAPLTEPQITGAGDKNPPAVAPWFNLTAAKPSSTFTVLPDGTVQASDVVTLCCGGYSGVLIEFVLDTDVPNITLYFAQQDD